MKAGMVSLQGHGKRRGESSAAGTSNERTRSKKQSLAPRSLTGGTESKGRKQGHTWVHHKA